MGEPGLCVPRLTTLERWIDPEGMPQVQLPIFPPGTTVLTSEMAVELRDSKVVYFNGHLPVFTHAATDIASFRLFTTQLIVNGIVSGAQIARVFGISDTTVKRCVKRYRERGPKAFFAPPPKRQGHKLTPERLVEVQTLLDQGEGVPAISLQVGILPSTLHKALDDGRLRHCQKKRPQRPVRRQPVCPQLP